MSRVRTHRLDPWEPVPATGGTPSRRSGWSLAASVDGIGDLDLGSRIAAAESVQRTAGNAAMATVLGHARTDHKTAPPTGVNDIIALSSPGNRGLTHSVYTGNAPIFRMGGFAQENGAWTTHPAPVRLPPLDHDVYWPAPGLHKLRSMGKGSQFLEVTDDWSNTLGEGESEHVSDNDAAYAMSWGKIADIINAMANEKFSGATTEAAQAAAWAAFRSRLPGLFRPEGETPTTEAQEKKWGADVDGNPFRKLMNESKRARDWGGWHTPDEQMKEMRGDDQIDELKTGGSKIGQVKTDQLMKDAWDKLAKA
jgi:hypothetical protein